MEAIQTDRPGYWAVIPATVRYDDKIPPNAKLLYGEISALTGKEGFCYAQNGYFAKLYGMRVETISRTISKLEKAGYIKVVIAKNDKNEITGRKIFLTSPAPPIDKKINTPCEKNQEGIDQKVKENNTSINNKKKEKRKNTNEPMTDEALREKVVYFISEHFGLWSRDQKNNCFQLIMDFYGSDLPKRSHMAVTAALNKLGRYSHEDYETAVDILESAIQGGWRGLYRVDTSQRPVKPAQEEDDAEWLE